MTTIAFLVLCVAVIVLAAQGPKPAGWIALVLATGAILLYLLGGHVALH